MDEGVRAYVDAMINAHVAVHEQERRALDFAIERMQRQLEEMGSRLDQLEQWRSKLAGRASVLLFIASVSAGFITILLGHLIFGGV